MTMKLYIYICDILFHSIRAKHFQVFIKCVISQRGQFLTWPICAQHSAVQRVDNKEKKQEACKMTIVRYIYYY